MGNTEIKEKARKDMNIYEKMLAIKEAIGPVQKTAEGFNYKYVPEDVLQSKLSAAMQELGVILRHEIIPGSEKVEEVEVTTVNERTGVVKTHLEYRFSASTKYTWINVDNPSEVIEDTYFALAQMTDASQAFGAAETYANRYYIMKTFQIPTPKDDPDYIINERSKAGTDDTPASARKGATGSYGKGSYPYNRPSATAPQGTKPSAPADDSDKINEEERRSLYALATEKLGRTEGAKAIRQYSESRNLTTSSDLTKAQMHELIGMINSAPKPGNDGDVPFSEQN